MEDEFRYQVWREFGRSLREVREARGMTQAELGERLSRFSPGGSQSSIAKMERGERLIAVDHVAALVWLLEVDLERLVPKVVEHRADDGEVADLLMERDRLRDQRWMGRQGAMRKRIKSIDA